MKFDTVLTKPEQTARRNEIITITEHKIAMFRTQLAQTPANYVQHWSIKKLIEVNERRLEELTNG